MGSTVHIVRVEKRRFEREGGALTFDLPPLKPHPFIFSQMPEYYGGLRETWAPPDADQSWHWHGDHGAAGAQSGPAIVHHSARTSQQGSGRQLQKREGTVSNSNCFPSFFLSSPSPPHTSSFFSLSFLKVFDFSFVLLPFLETADSRESYKWSENSHKALLPKEGNHKGGVQGDCPQSSRKGKSFLFSGCSDYTVWIVDFKFTGFRFVQWGNKSVGNKRWFTINFLSFRPKVFIYLRRFLCSVSERCCVYNLFSFPGLSQQEWRGELQQSGQPGEGLRGQIQACPQKMRRPSQIKLSCSKCNFLSLEWGSRMERPESFFDISTFYWMKMFFFL